MYKRNIVDYYFLFIVSLSPFTINDIYKFKNNKATNFFI